MSTNSSRRDFLSFPLRGIGATAALSLLLNEGKAAPTHFQAKAKRVIHVCLCGGMSHLDTFDYEPIVSVVLRAPDVRWRDPMLALRPGADAPAQFAFDLGALDPTRAGLYAFVVSGARAWVEQGLEATEAAVLRQAHAVFAGVAWRTCRTLAERRATFLCTPGLLRPAAMVARGLVAAGDYVDGPYPATLEGAVRSGASAASLTADV